jgi:signal peptidase I
MSWSPDEIKEVVTPSPDDVLDSSNQKEKQEHPLTEIIRFAIIALIIVVPIRWFVAQPFIVSGASMEDTFHGGEYLIVDQLSYYFEEPERGDVVIFRYPRDPSKFFIKRLIGIPGDTVTIEGNVVTITNPDNPEGVVLDEPYVSNMRPNSTVTEVLREEEYFVMGDNRDASSDSRTWGVLTREKIIGRAFLRLFPVTELGVMPGDHEVFVGLESSESTEPN